MPAIIAKSISILSDAGLGMAMFSLGQFLLFLLLYIYYYIINTINSQFVLFIPDLHSLKDNLKNLIM